MSQDIGVAFISIAVLRFTQVFLDYNYDRPDEYWQGPEIAYKIAYGYGFQSWQWTMAEPIRSPIYQLYLSLAYPISTLLQLSDYCRQISVRFMQILLGCVCDWFLLKIMREYTKNISYLTYVCLLTNWYYFSSMNRTYINSAETCLTMAAFYFWVTRKQAKWNDLISRMIVVLCFVTRPTSIIVWAIVWPYELVTSSSTKIKFIFKNIAQIVIMIGAGIAVSSWWFGRLTWVQYNFFKYNVWLKWSQLYGVNPYLYYFYVSIPLTLGAYLIPLALSLQQHLPNLRFYLNKTKLRQLKSEQQQQWKQKQRQITESIKFWQLVTIVVLALLGLSFSAHKQDRFILVLVPLLLVLAARGFQSLRSKRFVVIAIILINLFMFLTITLNGKTGGIKVLREIRQQIDRYSENKEVSSVRIMYLCEPHSLPLYSIILRNVTVSLIDSSPFKKLQGVDQNQQLINSPQQLYTQMKTADGPDFIILQEKYAVRGQHLNQNYQFLLQQNYQIANIYRNVHIWEQLFIADDAFILLSKK